MDHDIDPTMANQLFDKLTPRAQQALYFRFQGFQWDEVADFMDIGRSTIYKYVDEIHRTLKIKGFTRHRRDSILMNQFRKIYLKRPPPFPGGLPPFTPGSPTQEQPGGLPPVIPLLGPGETPTGIIRRPPPGFITNGTRLREKESRRLPPFLLRIALAIFAILIGTGAVLAFPQIAPPREIVVTRVATFIVEKPVPETLIVEKQVTQVVTQVVPQQVVITAPPAPTSTPDPIETRLPQDKATATALAVQVATVQAAAATAQAAKGAALAAQQTAEAKFFSATHPPLLGQAIEGNGLSLIALPGPYAVGNNSGYPTGIHFAADNRTGQRLNFNIIPSNFYMELSNGQRYPGVNAPIPINGFETNTRYTFDIEFSIIWDKFQAFQRDPAITHYFIVSSTGVNP